MSVKLITNFGHLMRLAKKVGKAEAQFLQGTLPPADFLAIKKEHDEYKALCLKADEMTTGVSLQNMTVNE